MSDEPGDAGEMNDALSAMGGMLWPMYQRLVAEGASMFEAALLAANLTAALINGASQKEES